MPSRAVTQVLLSSKYNNAVARLKSELTADGILSLFDLVYLLAAPSAQLAMVPIVGSSTFTLAPSGTVQFFANRGFTGDGSTGYLNTNYVPSTDGTNYTQNSACACAYNVTSRTANSTGSLLGANDATTTHTNYLVPKNTGGAFASTNTSAITYAGSPNASGFWHSNRSGSNASQLYRNGTSVATSVTASQTRAALSMVILANRQGASGAVADWSTDLCSAVFIGASLDATQAANLSTRVNTYMKTFGISVY